MRIRSLFNKFLQQTTTNDLLQQLSTLLLVIRSKVNHMFILFPVKVMQDQTNLLVGVLFLTFTLNAQFGYCHCPQLQFSHKIEVYLSNETFLYSDSYLSPKSLIRPNQQIRHRICLLDNLRMTLQKKNLREKQYNHFDPVDVSNSFQGITFRENFQMENNSLIGSFTDFRIYTCFCLFLRYYIHCCWREQKLHIL